MDAKRIRLVQIARKRLGLDEADYRALLHRCAGVQSSRDLTEVGFAAVMDEFARLGFRSTWREDTFGERRGMASPSQVRLIRELWSEYVGEGSDGAWKALDRWVARYHGVSALRFAEPRHANAIIAALRAMVARRRNEREAG